MKKLKLIAVFLLGLALASTTVEAVPTYSFEGLSNNNTNSTAVGEAQLFVAVSDPGGSQVLFTFINTGPIASSITDVYFDDGSLLGIALLIDADDGVGGDAGVDFTQLATPAELPSANNASPTFVTTTGFSADSDPPAQPNGVNPSESLGILFNLQGGQTYSDVLNELDNGTLRIGIHVQGIYIGPEPDDDESESFVNNGVIPAPGAILLGSIGVGLVGWLRRRRTL